MNSFRLITTYSPWLILACLAVGLLYAWLLYSKRAPWPKSINYALAVLRFVVVSFISFLLLGPLVRYVSNTTQEPTIVFALDNSQSVKLFSDSVQLKQAEQGLQNIVSKLQDAGYKTEIRTLANEQQQSISELNYISETTNLSQLLSQVQEEYAEQNLAGVVLLSDGIVNQGMSPAYANYGYTLYPVALGDTIPKKDVLVASLRYNKVNYSGNRFPLEVELQQEGFAGRQANVILKENGKAIARKTVSMQAGQPVQQVPFQVLASGLGKRHYEVEVQPLQGEFTTLNNTKHAYIDVVKGKIKVLVAAAAPHPDIKAIRAAIESNENYETTLYIPGLMQLKPQDYDVAVLHQLPGRVAGGEAALNLVRQKNLPALYILGPQSDLNDYNRLNVGLNISSNGQQDEVTPIANANFTTFKLPEAAPERLQQYPPARVPFGDVRLNPNTEVVLYQQVGRVKTNKPMLAVQTSGDKRNATLLASGIWQWRIIENANNEQPEVYDKLITNLIQLLSAPRNKKRLNVYPMLTEYTSSEEVRFNAEAYNEALEPIYGQNITLSIKNDEGQTRNFNFANGENQAGVNIGTLDGGRYTYTATARINGQMQQDKGEFVVEELQLEALNSVADHTLLYQLASNTGSKLYYPAQLQQLEQDILKAEHKPKIYSSEELKDLVDLKWLFFLLLGFICVEWFIRKYNGSY
ncbi:vWA domain-containing protein [Pontibacter cellulosilyticus]|uniref:VWA domain-containing protein n=1 Tax=Pontibacter cellulosilyticus TaxID=1720253 RepID=A0A923N8Y8_9BACT|nr:vWA domain-containing protein [Pontibacter cellulosilyticus]MBC5995008.1 VWA domain-containing protein [Pontibacter cellulosilyticus]